MHDRTAETPENDAEDMPEDDQASVDEAGGTDAAEADGGPPD